MSRGIKIFGFLSVGFSLYMVSYVVVITDYFTSLNMFAVAYSMTAVCWLVFGVGVLKLLSWARVGLVLLAGIYFIDYVDHPSYISSAIKHHDIGALIRLVAGLIFFVSLIVFFTRSNVKKQFINKSIVGVDT